MSLILPSDYEGGMVKLCTWGPFAEDGWPHVQRLVAEGRGTHTKFAAWTKKFASRETGELVQRFVKESQPKPGHEYFLSTSLGAFEAWGSNNNGDAFYEEDLVKESEDVGYKSFVKHARVYEHHRNKDPQKAIGKIVLATYNPRMRRVELIRELDRVKAAQWIGMWHENGSMPTSMGCKVAYDVCSWCNHRAKTPADYCEHAKTAMKKIASNGHRFHVRNPDPRFFDDSCVIVPADKTAGAMEKIASSSYPDIAWSKEGHTLSAVEGELAFREIRYEKVAEEKQADANHHADLGMEAALEQGMTAEQALSHQTTILATNDEVLSAEDARILKIAADSDPELPKVLLEKMACYPLEMAIATMHHLGIVPQPREYQYLALCESNLSKIAEDLYERDLTFQPSVSEETPDAYEKSAYVADWNVSAALVEDLTPFVPTRSYIPEFLEPRLEKAAALAKRGEAVIPAEDIRASDPGLARIMMALGASYGVVRLIMGQDKKLATGLMKVTKTHPAVAAALLTAGVAAGLKLIGSAVTPGSVTPRMGGSETKLAEFVDDLEKVAGPKEWGDWVRKTPSSVKHVVVPFSVGYLGSAYMRGKQMRGQPTSSVENVVAEHPLASGVAAVTGTALARKGLQKLVTAVKP